MRRPKSELDELARLYSGFDPKDKLEGLNLIALDQAAGYKAGYREAEARTLKAILKAIDCSDEWHDTNIQYWLEENAKRILGHE